MNSYNFPRPQLSRRRFFEMSFFGSIKGLPELGLVQFLPPKNSNFTSSLGFIVDISGEIITTSLRPHRKLWFLEGNHPQMALIQVSESL